MFDEVWIAESVKNELLAGRSKGYDVPNPADYTWLNIVNPKSMPSEWLALDLGAGELGAMALALENPDRIVLLDDMLARRTVKQNASLAKSPTRTEITQTNHFVAALWAFVKIELLKVQTKKNHYQIKSQLYFSALQVAFDELRKLKSELYQQPATA